MPLFDGEAPVISSVGFGRHVSHGVPDLIATAPLSASTSTYVVYVFDGKIYRRGACYEVGGEVASQFEARFVTPGPGDRFLLDLAAANRAQLEEAGATVHRLGICTKESVLLPSHRRAPDGLRFGAIVALR